MPNSLAHVRVLPTPQPGLDAGDGQADRNFDWKSPWNRRQPCLNAAHHTAQFAQATVVVAFLSFVVRGMVRRCVVRIHDDSESIDISGVVQLRQNARQQAKHGRPTIQLKWSFIDFNGLPE
jgi:hypothetical protein